MAFRAEILAALEGALLGNGGKQLLWPSHQKVLCSCFCYLRAMGDYRPRGACHQETGRTGRVPVLPPHLLLPALCYPGTLEQSGKEALNPSCIRTEELTLRGFFFTTVIKAWPIDNISGFVLVYGRWRCVIIPSFPFWACFLNRVLFLHQAHLFFWWLQELKCSSSLQV